MADKHSSLTASLPRRNKATEWVGMEHGELPPPGVGFIMPHPCEVDLVLINISRPRNRSHPGWGLVHFSANRRILRSNGWPKTWTCPLPAARWSKWELFSRLSLPAVLECRTSRRASPPARRFISPSPQSAAASAVWRDFTSCPGGASRVLRGQAIAFRANPLGKASPPGESLRSSGATRNGSWAIPVARRRFCPAARR